MLFETTAVLFVVFLVTAYYYYRFHRTAVKNCTRAPGPQPEWFFGNLRNTGMTSGGAIHDVYITLKVKYGDAFSFWLGPYYSIVISRLEYVQHVLTDRHTYDVAASVTDTFGVLFPNGLIALRGDDWKRHARFMLPMFKRAKALPYLNTISNCMDRFIEQRFVERDGQIHTDLVAQCQNVLLNIIGFIAFDYDLESSSKTDGLDMHKALRDFVVYGNRFILLTGIPTWLGKFILFFSWRYQRALRTMKYYLMNIINEEQKRQEDESIASNRPKNLIASLVSSIKSESSSSSSKAFLTPEEVFDEVSLSILGGFETTSTGLSWFIFYMSKYPHVQQKIKDELRQNHLSCDTPLTQDLLDSLIYTECVVKETLRWAPIAGGISREATRDDTIGDISIKKGDIITIATQNLHHDPRYWKVDPTQFIPERFLNEDKNPPQYAFMPFGGGHRACAGQELAFFELKVVITRLMQRVTFEDPGDEANNTGGFVQRITCTPKHLAVRVRISTESD